MQTLPNRANRPEVHVLQPGLPALRRQADPAAGHTAHRSIADCGTQAREPGDMGVVWPQRARDSLTGQRLTLRWPGRSYGVRCPDIEETPLSWAEVTLGVRAGVVRPLAKSTESI